MPLLAPCRAETSVLVTENGMGLARHRHAGLTQPPDLGLQVADAEVQRGRWRTALDQQADVARDEEQQTRRVEPSSGRRSEEQLVEPARPVQIVRVLCNLEDLH